MKIVLVVLFCVCSNLLAEEQDCSVMTSHVKESGEVDTASRVVLQYLAQQYKCKELLQPISLDTQQITISELIRHIAQKLHIPILCEGELHGSVARLRIVQKPAGQILHMLLTGLSKKYSILLVDGVLHVASHATIVRRARIILSGSFFPTQRATISYQHSSMTETVKLQLESMWHHCIREHVGPRRLQYFFIDDEHKTIFVQGTPEQVKQFRQMVASRDVVTPQVYITARFISVRSHHRAGKGLQVQVGYERERQNAFQFKGVGEVGRANLASAVQLVSSLLAPTFTIPLVFGGTDLQAQQLNIVLNAAERNNVIKTLLEPHIMSCHGKRAQLLEGQNIPIESSTEETTEGKVRNIRSAQYKEVGIQFKVVPRVLPCKKRVKLDVLIENSHVIPGSGANSYPTITTSKIRNTVLLKSGQIALIGGLIHKKQSNDRLEIPLLSRLPLIGSLFTGTGASEEEERLYVFLRAVLRA